MIDVDKPMEAVHKETGQTVSVTFRKWTEYPGNRFFETNECPADDTNENWYPDGRDYCHSDLWFIRNVEEKAMTITVRTYEGCDHMSLMDRTFATREEAAEFISEQRAEDRERDFTGWTYRAFETVERELTIEEKITLS